MADVGLTSEEVEVERLAIEKTEEADVSAEQGPRDWVSGTCLFVRIDHVRSIQRQSDRSGARKP
jgi:hypothetical protein